MHFFTLFKLKNDDPDDARDSLQSFLEDHAGEGHNFDYIGHIDRVVKTVKDKDTETPLADFAPKGNKKPYTFADLERKYNQYTLDHKKRFLEQIKETLFIKLAEYFMSPEEAPLYVSNDNEKIREVISKVLSSGKKELSFDKKLEKFAEILTEDPMLSWYVKKVSDINDGLEYSDADDLAEMDYISFIDLTKSENEEFNQGDETYYFIVDRHS